MLDTPEIPNIELPDDIKNKIKEIKAKAEKFKDKLLKEYKDKIIGVALVPPPKDIPKEKLNRNDIYIFVLINLQETKTIKEFNDFKKILDGIDKIALEVDKNIKPQALSLFELRETLYDGKYDILQMISMGELLYDPKILLGALKVSEVHKSMVLKKFEKYIVCYVAAGSLFRGEKANDIDTYIVIDDTDVKKMSRFELREKLRNIIIQYGFNASDLTGVKLQFHVQIYILTDFWESVKDAHPVIFTFLRDGVPLYDRGIFMPWKLLLEMGRIRPSPESIDMHMDMGEKLVDRAKKRLIGIVMEDLFYAALNPSQAALMLYGLAPPVPKETVQLMKDIFVKKEKMLEARHLKALDDIVTLFKALEHGKIKEITGAEIDKHAKRISEYLKRIDRLFTQIEKRQQAKSIEDVHKETTKLVRKTLESSKIKMGKDISKSFEIYVNKNKLPSKFLRVFKDVLNAKKLYKEKKLRRAEAEKIKREARTFIRLLIEHTQKKRLQETEKATIRFKYGNKVGEAILLEKDVYIIKDIKPKEKVVLKSGFKKDGSLKEPTKSSMKEIEEQLLKIYQPAPIHLKEKVFESLKKILGSDVEILVNY